MRAGLLSGKTARVVTAILVVLVAAAIVIPAITSKEEPPPAARSPLQRTDRVSGIVLEPLGPRPPIDFDSLRGKPIVLNAFASTCAPCIEEMPRFQAMYESVGREVAFVGVAVNDYAPAAQELVRRTGVRYPVGADPRGEVYLAIGGLEMPTTWFIDERGKILETFAGEISAEELRSRIRTHFPNSRK